MDAVRDQFERLPDMLAVPSGPPAFGVSARLWQPAGEAEWLARRLAESEARERELLAEVRRLYLALRAYRGAAEGVYSAVKAGEDVEFITDAAQACWDRLMQAEAKVGLVPLAAAGGEP